MHRLRIQHLTEYQFSASVTLNPHRLLLRPREGHDVRIESSRLSISPNYQIHWHRDVFDNSVAMVNFAQTSHRLSIFSEVVIQHYADPNLSANPELILKTATFKYDSQECLELSAFRKPVYLDDKLAVSQWLHKLGICEHCQQSLPLLLRLNQAINQQFSYRIREEVGVQSPALTIQLGNGSCRDYATLMMEACRLMGFASRFVSGYLHAPATEAGNATTHAWTEVYLPGFGWQGFDPTSGCITGNQHIPVAVARIPELVSPVSGSYIGPRNTPAILIVNVKVNKLA